ncbi:MAG: hypothetical protein MJ086_07335 [Lachnospiraceae bacterium]|nr:hypothetical protein [Lachnospiraceae bacterium]
MRTRNIEVIRKVMVMVALMMFVLLVSCGKKEEEDKNETGVTEDVSIGDDNTESDVLDEFLASDFAWN